MNGKPLSQTHGAPAPPGVPGWYGVAWVKWLWRIEVHDRRFLSRFMGRDYVTIRGEERGRRNHLARDLRRPHESQIHRGPGHPYGWRGRPGHGRGLERRHTVEGGRTQAGRRPLEEDRVGRGEGPSPLLDLLVLCLERSNAGRAYSRVQSRRRPGPGPAGSEDEMIRLKKTYWEANQQIRRRIQL